MSAVERLEEGHDEKASPPPSAAAQALSIDAEPAAKNRSKLRPLIALAPYVARYRGRAVLALIALTVAAMTTLLVPVAVRRMIDFGFKIGRASCRERV